MDKFSEIWPRRNRWNRALLTWQKNKISPSSPAVASRYYADRAQNLPGPTPHNVPYSEFSRYHPNRFTFGGVIAERVNTTKTRRKVNPIFGWSLASSRIIKLQYTLYFVASSTGLLRQHGDIEYYSVRLPEENSSDNTDISSFTFLLYTRYCTHSDVIHDHGSLRLRLRMRKNKLQLWFFYTPSVLLPWSLPTPTLRKKERMTEFEAHNTKFGWLFCSVLTT